MFSLFLLRILIILYCFELGWGCWILWGPFQPALFYDYLNLVFIWKSHPAFRSGRMLNWFISLMCGKDTIYGNDCMAAQVISDTYWSVWLWNIKFSCWSFTAALQCHFDIWSYGDKKLKEPLRFYSAMTKLRTQNFAEQIVLWFSTFSWRWYWKNLV